MYYRHHALIAEICDEEPLSLKDALAHDHWVEAMKSELGSIYKNNTWELCDLPKGRKAIATKWIYKVKHNADGSIGRFKARPVAKGCSQKEGIDYEETFAPTSKMTTIRATVAAAAIKGWKVHQLDIKTTLNGDLEEEVYVAQPPGFIIKGAETKVCRLYLKLCTA